LLCRTQLWKSVADTGQNQPMFPTVLNALVICQIKSAGYSRKTAVTKRGISLCLEEQNNTIGSSPDEPFI
jgi:hypothetical protein